MTAAPGMTSEQAKQDHLRLQNDLAQLSTNSQHVMVPNSGHQIYFYEPAIVTRSISAVAKVAQTHSRLNPIE